MEPRSLTISWEMLWRVFFMVLLGWLLFAASNVLVALLLAIVISTAFDPIVSFLERYRIPRILGTLFIYLAAAAAFGVMIYALVPIAIDEITIFLKSSSGFIGPALETLNAKALVSALSAALNQFSDFLSGDVSIADLATRFLGGAFFGVAVFAISFYLTVGRDGVRRFLIAVLPSASEDRALRVYERVSRKIGRWLAGQVFLSLFIGVAIFLGLWLLGVKYSLFIGILAAIAELVPYVGPIFTGSLAVLIGLSESLSLGLYVFLLFIVVQQLESHVLIPAVMRYTTTLNPVVVITALLIGGSVFGIVGIILAVPIAVLFQEILEDWAEVKASRREAARG